MKIVADIFEPVVSEQRFHPQFRDLRKVSFYSGARSLMNELYSEMDDPNGNFVRDFQTHGFHARLFELSCFAYLKSAGLEIDRSFERPDFMVSRDGVYVAVEAVTANTPGNQSNDISVAQMAQLSQLEILAKVIDDFPKRMGNSLRKKKRAAISRGIARIGKADRVNDRPLL